MTNQGRASRVALALVLSIGLAGGCATAKPKPAGPRVESIAITGEGDRARIVVRGSVPLEYTAFRLSDPPRVVVDVPGVALGSAAGVRPSPAPIVSQLTASEVTEGTSRIARIEITIDPSTSFTVTPDAAAKSLSIELAAEGAVRLGEPAGAAPAPTLEATLAAPGDAVASQAGPAASAVDLTAPRRTARPTAAAAAAGPLAVRKITAGRTADGATELVVEATAPIAKYEVFRLASPPRLVLDIQDAKNKVTKRQIRVNDGRVKQIRLGAYANKVRVVFDLAAAADVPYEAAPDRRGLVVTLSGKAAAARPPASPPAADAPAAPAVQPVALETVAPAPTPPASSPRAPEAAAPAAPVDPLAGVVGRPGDGGLPAPRPRPQIVGLAAQRAFEIRDSGKRYTGRRISLDFKDAEIDNILRLIAEISNLNIVTSDDVKGKLSLRLVNVPWDQALDIVLESQGLGMVRTGNVIRIAPAAKLKAEDDAAIAAKAAKQKLEDLTLEIIPVNYATAKELESQVKPLLSDRGKLTVDTRTNALIVTDVKTSIEQARALVEALDTVTPQVLIEARIVEASLDFTREIGVQWGGTFTSSAATGNPTGLNFPGRIDVTGGAGSGFAVNLPAAVNQGSGGAINFALGSLTNFLNLDVRLSALERTGEGRVISSPRVTTLDNKEAVIEQGLSIPFETTSDSGTQTTFIDANLNLTVTPHVTNDESISLKIKASKNAPDSSVRGASGAPSIAKKEARTEVLIRNGQTTVIGGIYQIDRSDTVAGVPWFQKLPLFGWLFKKTSVIDKKTELLIFITPRIVRPVQQQAASR
jgi:type IV pilus assembly protein PilQ